jgi:hypothetical protein
VSVAQTTGVDDRLAGGRADDGYVASDVEVALRISTAPAISSR